MADETDDERSTSDEEPFSLPLTPDEVRAFRLRAREIVNIVLELTDRIADPDAPPRERAECMACVAGIYAKAIGVSAKQAARMTLIEALVETAARPRPSNEAELRKQHRALEGFGGISQAAVRATLEREQPGGERDVQEVWWSFELSFPDRIVALRHPRARVLIPAALAAVARTEGQHRKPGEEYKWEPIAALMNAADLGPVAATTLPVEWSRWKRATQASAQAVTGKRRGRPPKAR